MLFDCPFNERDREVEIDSEEEDLEEYVHSHHKVRRDQMDINRHFLKLRDRNRQYTKLEGPSEISPIFIANISYSKGTLITFVIV